jgi:putative FmdB family regulatory protein
MPLYEFYCPTCGKDFERSIPFQGDLGRITCPSGHGGVRRIYSAPQVTYKGAGWYSTDHRKVDRSSAKIDAP